MSTTPDPVSTPGPGEPDPLRPASDPDIVLPMSPGPLPDDSPDALPDPDVDRDAVLSMSPGRMPDDSPDALPDPDVDRDAVPPRGPGRTSDDSPDPFGAPDVDDVADQESPGPEETAQGLQSQPDAADPSADDPGTRLNY